MPGRGFRGAGFLDQHMIVEHLNPLRRHQRRGHLGHPAFADHPAEFRDPLPVAVIVEEAPRLAGLQVLGSVGTGLGHVAGDALADQVDPVGPEPFYQHGAIALIGFDHLISYQHRRPPA